ncbi:MAG: hypothetical protein R3358_09500 [Woeseiaceae bacterium]|nr:hypothetical protein [Woeseiaceae bacterium]
MIVVFGTYNWRPRDVAFRRDLCLRCKFEGVAVARRTWDFFHLFWIPVLPLGRWTRWHCAVCDQDPAVATSVRRPFRLMLVAIGGLLFLSAAFRATADGYYSAEITWLIRVGAILAIAALAWWALRPGGSPEWRRRREAVSAYAEPGCPLCGAHLSRSLDGTRCTGCEAEHRPLEKKDDMLSLYS